MARTFVLRTPKHKWFIYVGYKGKYGDRLRVVRLNIRDRDVTGGWTLIKGKRPS